MKFLTSLQQHNINEEFETARNNSKDPYENTPITWEPLETWGAKKSLEK